MTSPDPRDESNRPLPPEHRRGGEPDAMAPAAAPLADREVPPSRHPEAALGGADAVEKTTYSVGARTDPHAVTPDRPTAHPEPGSGINLTAWIAGGIVVLIAMIYLAGLFG